MNALDTSFDAGAGDAIRTSRRLDGRNAFRRAAGWLGLAAAPAFAAMALLTALSGVGPADMLCAAARGTSPLSGMVPMYVLMSAIHLAPWLKLISRGLPSPSLRGHGRGKAICSARAVWPPP
jgi:hypothetical protein